MPSVSRALAADEPPPPTLSSPATQVVETAPTAARPTPPVTDVAPPMPALPDEGAMTDSERRRMQEALARIGYYGGRVDGLFGPETRAAIRRFQHEIGVETTGVITGEQAARLVTWK
jgi:peptidoglycan hydrolase-like protein with peptidoglycan-binding domain